MNRCWCASRKTARLESLSLGAGARCLSVEAVPTECLSIRPADRTRDGSGKNLGRIETAAKPVYGM